MKNLNTILLAAMVTLTTNIFADDIWFVSPQNGQNFDGQLTIQIHPPYQNVNVNVWIEEEEGWNRNVWRGTLNAANKYTVVVDTKRFKPGLYEVNAEYFLHREDYDGDVKIWIGGTPSPQGEYLPQ